MWPTAAPCSSHNQARYFIIDTEMWNSSCHILSCMPGYFVAAVTQSSYYCAVFKMNQRSQPFSWKVTLQAPILQKNPSFENTSWTTSVQTEKCHSAGSRENIYEGALSSQYSLHADTIPLHPQGRILWIERGLSPWEKAQEGGGMNGTLLHSANCLNSRTTAQFHNLSPSTPLFYFSFKADKTSAGLSK